MHPNPPRYFSDGPLARRLALVEGPSDALVLERAIRDATARAPLDLGIDIVSMGGLTFKRALEVCACLSRQAVALADNDGNDPSAVIDEVAHLLDPPHRDLLVSDPEGGPTLEPQIVAANGDEAVRVALRLTDRADLLTWMRNNKAEAGLRILDAQQRIRFPDYIQKAVALLT